MKIIEVDSRNRISLGELCKHEQYLVRMEDDGTILLIPAVVIALTELKKMERQTMELRDELNKAKKALDSEHETTLPSGN